MLYIDGGSNTYGDELENREKNAWPFLLAHKLNLPVINQALKGKSNQHMVFDLVNFCSKQKPDFVVIGWVNIHRKMFVRRENNFLIDISPSGQNSVYQTHEEFKNFQTLLYKYWSNYLYDAWQFLHHVVLVQKFLESQNIAYLMFNDSDQSDLLKLLTISSEHFTIKDSLLDAFDQMDDQTISEVEHDLRSLYGLINHDDFYDFSWHILKLVQFHSHPSMQHHLELSNFFFSLIENKL